MMQPQRIFGLTGRSGMGKTTLLLALLAELRQRGLTVNAIKHSHHDLQLEPPDKDSARMRAAGAQEVLVASPYRYAIVHELHGAAEPTLAEQVARLVPADLTLVEGFKREPHPKIEVWRAASGQTPLYPEDPAILAVASDAPVSGRYWLDLNQPARIADYILQILDIQTC
ncbi:molybdopterin-guanine dinucleotide biosynthesis protein B [Chitinibacter tainanensis]|uniref:molybdopterin-guanine dinucleotide biosynthesis protein B n=1 Tax=Chitinibacter tainanensis TaxID=230667 RepID=UPI002355F8A9|nr:molybdopterin-guanine dinucleotide biosynthesis protein B [Chitinibacter tainanensis]